MFKRGIIILLIILGSSQSSGQDRPKIGLVLSGGAAMGLAHVGVIKLIDSLEIPIDYIAGTSMGGLLGALYSIGYSGTELEKLALDMDWEKLFSDIPPRNQLPYFQKIDVGKYQLEFGIENYLPVPSSGLVKGQNIALKLSQLTFPYAHITDFDQLPIPFRCTAVDLNSGQLVILNEGSLAKAMRSTMSIPTVFSPVQWGDSLLVDGGLLDNCPVSTAREMGADIIIAVSVGWNSRTYSDLKYGIDILIESGNIVRRAQLYEGTKDADIHIYTELEAFRGIDFERHKIVDLIKNGEVAAAKSRSELMDLKATLDQYKSADLNQRIEYADSIRIHSLSIVGNTYLPFPTIYGLLQIKPNDYFDQEMLEQQIQKMLLTGYFKKIDYKLIQYKTDYVKLFIEVVDKKYPLINGVRITGNERLSFSFIYRLLGIKPGERFNVKTVQNRIDDLYGLGYFEKIDYEIHPVDEKKIDLIINIEENSLRKLRLGAWYDSRYAFVGVLNLQGTDILLPGVRWDNTVQFLGLNKFESKIFYPSRTLDFPIYPYLKLNTSDIPIDLFDPETGSKIAVYRYRSILLSAGAGIQQGNDWILESEYQQEYLRINTTVGFPELGLFPSVENDILSGFNFKYNLDRLDNYTAPRQGIKIDIDYAGFYKRVESEVEFSRYELAADYYHPFNTLHSMRLYLRHGGGSNLPEVKHFMFGGKDDFLGVQYGQLMLNKFTFARLDYRYFIRKNLMVFCGANILYDIDFDLVNQHKDLISGFGLGVKIYTPVGIIEAVYSQGPKAVFTDQGRQYCFYFKAGYSF